MSSPSFLRRLTRAAAGVGVTSLLVVSAGAPASAAADQFRAEATGVGVKVSLFDMEALTLEGASSMALLVDEGDAAARGVGLNQIDSSISESDLRSGEQRDPESGDNCATPALPEPLDDLPVGLACSNAFARAGDLNTARAEGFLGEVDLDGDFLTGLVDFLIDAVLADAAAALDSAIDPLEEATGPLVGPVAMELAAQCNALLSEATGPTGEALDALGGVLGMDPTGVVGPGLQELVTALNDAFVQTLPEACSSLINVLTNLPEIAVILDDLRAALQDALNGLDLIQLTLGGTVSSVETTADSVTAMAIANGARLELPSLADLVAIIEEFVPALVGALTDQVAEQVADALEDIIPAVVDLLDPVLEALMLPDLLTIDEPLLVLDAGVATVSSTLDRNDVTTATSGSANSVVITLSSAFATLLGEDNTTITIPGGDSAEFGEDTPLASSISVLAVSEVSREVDDESFPLTGSRAGGVELNLFTTDEFMGGITIVLAGAEAVVGGVGDPSPAPAPEAPTTTPPPAPAPPTTPTLPVTGGGLALLGLIAAGGALAIGRRRD